MNNFIFIPAYLFVMTLTYGYRFAATQLIMDHPGDPTYASHTAAVANWMLFFSYVVLALLAYFKGKANDKKYLGFFPLIAAVFDCVLVFIPFVPTVLNLVTLIMALIEKPKTSREAS